MPQISLAPPPFFMEKKKLLRLYDLATTSPIEIIYLGETICRKRAPLDFRELISLAEKLRNIGKEVVLSSPLLINSEQNSDYLEKIVDIDDFAIEANEMTAVSRMITRNKKFICGNGIHIYNNHSFKLMTSMGMFRWQPPNELDLNSVIKISDNTPVATEITIYGKKILAFSARCFSAYAKNKNRENCSFACKNGENELKTLDGNKILTTNGPIVMPTNPVDLTSFDQNTENNHIKDMEILRIIPTETEPEKQMEIINTVINKLQ